MKNSYINKNKIDINDEINLCYDVINRMKENGLNDFSISDIDFNFTSNDKEKLEKLKLKLEMEFDFKIVYLKKISRLKSEYELSITICSILMTEELIIYLIIYLFDLAIDHDCLLGDWGALIDDTKMFDFDKVDVDTIMKEGYQHYENGKFYLAFVKFIIVIQKNNDAEAHYNVGCIKHDFGLIKSAIKSYTKAIEIDDKNKTPFLNRGVAFYDLGEYEKAIEDYMKIVENFPNEHDPYINIGNAYIALKNKEKAIEYYDKAINLGSDDAKIAKEKGLNSLV